MKIWLLWAKNPADEMPYLVSCVDEYTLDNWNDPTELFQKLEADVPDGELKRWVTTEAKDAQVADLFQPAEMQLPDMKPAEGQ